MNEDTIRNFRRGLTTIHDLAGWHADDEANPENSRPEDQTAHVNGLIRQECLRMLAMLEISD